MQVQVQPNVIGNVSVANEALFDQYEENKDTVTPNRRRRHTPRKIPDDEFSGAKSPMTRGKSSVRTRQANAAAGRL